MRFSTVFSVLSCGAMALAAAVSPAALVSRSNDEVAAVLNTCGTKLDAAFAKLGSFLSSGAGISSLLNSVLQMSAKLLLALRPSLLPLWAPSVMLRLLLLALSALPTRSLPRLSLTLLW